MSDGNGGGGGIGGFQWEMVVEVVSNIYFATTTHFTGFSGACAPQRRFVGGDRE